MSAVGRLRRVRRFRAVGHCLAVRRPRDSGDPSVYENPRSLDSPTSEQSRAGASLPAPAPFTSRPPPRAALLVGMTSSPASISSPTSTSLVSAARLSGRLPRIPPSLQRHPARPRFHEVKGCARILAKKGSSTGIAGSFFGHRIAFRESWLRLFCISPDQRIAIGCSSRRC